MKRRYFHILKICVVLGILFSQTSALTCYQCNVFIRGSPWPCNSERGMREIPNCYACLKTYTRTYLHNTFHDQQLISYESRLCVKDKDYVKDAGCHPHETGSGYMKRCFCFDDLCNNSPRTHITLTFSGLCILVALLFNRVLWNQQIHLHFLSKKEAGKISYQQDGNTN